MIPPIPLPKLITGYSKAHEHFLPSLRRPTGTFLNLKKVNDRLMPELDTVKEEAVLVRKLMTPTPKPPPMNIKFVAKDGQDLGTMHPGLVYHVQFCSLFLWSYFCGIESTPIEIYPPVCVGTPLAIKAYGEVPEGQLPEVGSITPQQKNHRMAFVCGHSFGKSRHTGRCQKDSSQKLAPLTKVRADE